MLLFELECGTDGGDVENIGEESKVEYGESSYACSSIKSSKGSIAKCWSSSFSTVAI